MAPKIAIVYVSEDASRGRELGTAGGPSNTLVSVLAVRAYQAARRR